MLCDVFDTDGLVQERRNRSALGMEIHTSFLHFPIDIASKQIMINTFASMYLGGGWGWGGGTTDFAGVSLFGGLSGCLCVFFRNIIENVSMKFVEIFLCMSEMTH